MIGVETFFDVLERAKFLISLLQKKVTKSAWRMPWLSEAMKDVISCDKLRGGANNRYIRRFPNGETLPVEDGKPLRFIGGEQTRRTETSKYPEEEKTIVIPLVVAIERGIAQTLTVSADRGL
jgi:hypothetical protein